MSALLFVDTIRRIEADGLARTAAGELMARAASAVADAAEGLLRDSPAGQPVFAFCGPGNNGGDALLAALLLHERGFDARAFELAGCAAGAAPPEDTARVRARAASLGLSPARIESAEALRRLFAPWADGARAHVNAPAPLVIDGLFGIGLARPLDGLAADLCRLLARLDTGVVAIDVPSGVDADTGALVGTVAIPATLTVTMIADKPGLHTGRALDHVGRLSNAPLGLGAMRSELDEISRQTPEGSTPKGEGSTRAREASVPPGGEASVPPGGETSVPPGGETSVPIDEASTQADGVLFGRHEAARLLPRRPRDSSKGTFGSVLVVGGATGMSGAALLAARAAQHGGAGKVWIASPQGPVFDPGQPQLMTRGADAAFDGVDVLVAGCGLGTGARARELLLRVLASASAAVLDADALNLLATDRTLALRPPAAASNGAPPAATASGIPRVLTPHPLEAARLADCSPAEIQKDRIAAAVSLASKFEAVVALKGAGTVVAAPDARWAIIDAGGPALATAGTGDVLAGLIGSLLAQGLSDWEATLLGCWVHGDAGDRWSVAAGLGAWRESARGVEVRGAGGLSAAELPALARESLAALSGEYLRPIETLT